MPNAAAAPLTATAPPMQLATKAFAVLGGSAVTNTGNSIINGDLGVSPGTSITGVAAVDGGPGVVNGSIHQTDAVAEQAQSDVTAAYNDLAGQACDQTLSGDLGGLTLAPGVYCFTSDAGLTGVLTLDAQGDAAAVWVFKIGSTLITASNASVSMVNGGKACNVWWQVGSSATLGTGTAFSGNILAAASITLNTGAAMFGAALARSGAVTLDTNNVTSCFGPNAVALRKFQAAPAARFPLGPGAGAAALLLVAGLIVIRRRGAAAS